MEPRPEGGVVAGGVEGFDKVGIEPGTAAGFGHGEGGVESVAVVEDLRGLSEAEDAGEDGDFLAEPSGGVALTVPMFIEAADGEGGFLGHEEIAGDHGAAIAAHLDQFAGDGCAVAGDAHEGGDARHEIRAGSGVAENVAHFFGEAGPVRGFEVALGLAIVGPEQVAEFGGVAGAAEVFKEQGVKKGGALFGGEVDFLGDAHADHAGADGVAFRLAFGDVERVGEGGDDFREPEVGGGGSVAEIGHEYLRGNLPEVSSAGKEEGFR